jgi:hypothetical protein
MVISHNLKAIVMINLIKYFQKIELFLCARNGYTNSRATSLSAFLADIEAEYMRWLTVLKIRSNQNR